MNNGLQGIPYGQCVWGYCHRCGAPKAPVMIGGGAQMVLCTRCTSKEDQEAQLQAEAMARRYTQS